LVYLGQDSHEANKDKPWFAKIARDPEGKRSFEDVKRFETSGFFEGLNSKAATTLSKEELKLAKFKNLVDPLRDIRKYLKTPSLQKLTEKSNKAPVVTKRKAEDEVEDVRKRKKRKKDKKSHKSKKKSKKHHKKHKSKKHSSSSSSDYSSESEAEAAEKRKQTALKKLREERLQREREERRRTEKLLAKVRGDPEEEEKAKDVDPKIEALTTNRVKQKYNSQFNPELARQNYG